MPLMPPARVGQPVSEIDTPALVVDLNAMERNIETLAAMLPETVKLRAHAKTHKSAEIGKRQMARGAVGVCCQKVSEAAMLVEAGITNVLVSNQVVGTAKLNNLAELSKHATLGVCVDALENIDSIAAALEAAGPDAGIDVLVEIDVGSRRCGVAPGQAAVALAERVAGHNGMRFAGLQAYHGSAQHLRTAAERRLAIDGATDAVRRTTAALSEAGIECKIIAGAGTGTFQNEMASGVYNELQAGSYVFMDADYARNLDEHNAPISTFEHSLFVVSTVMSATRPGHAVLDAGHKSVAIDCGYPTVWRQESVEYVGASDDHGVLSIAEGSENPSIGERVWLVPGHCDPTVNLHNWYVAVRDDVVEAVWPVDARGAIY